MNICIQVNLTRKNAYDVTVAVLKKLSSFDVNIYMDCELKNQFNEYNVCFHPFEESVSLSDIIISIGGDGTFIHTSHIAAKYDKPILGINAGNLGFLTGLEKSELNLLENLINNDYQVDNRMMICCEFYKNNVLVSKDYCLNDVVIARGNSLKLCDIRLIVDGKISNSYVADGLIFSTPTGSTAYSLSAGGPVMDPTIECIITTPICTHTIFNRSIIFRSDSNIEAFVSNNADTNAIISLDGQDPIEMSEYDKIVIRKGNRRVKVLRLKTDSFTDILNYKLTERRNY